jgi:toxin ParE1/3/4
LLKGQAHAGIRKCVFGNYLIFYRVREDIEVLHILNSARDFGAILGDEQ